MGHDKIGPREAMLRQQREQAYEREQQRQREERKAASVKPDVAQLKTMVEEVKARPPRKKPHKPLKRSK